MANLTERVQTIENRSRAFQPVAPDTAIARRLRSCRTRGCGIYACDSARGNAACLKRLVRLGATPAGARLAASNTRGSQRAKPPSVAARLSEGCTNAHCIAASWHCVRLLRVKTRSYRIATATAGSTSI